MSPLLDGSRASDFYAYVVDGRELGLEAAAAEIAYQTWRMKARVEPALRALAAGQARTFTVARGFERNGRAVHVERKR